MELVFCIVEKKTECVLLVVLMTLYGTNFYYWSWNENDML